MAYFIHSTVRDKASCFVFLRIGILQKMLEKLWETNKKIEKKKKDGKPLSFTKLISSVFYILRKMRHFVSQCLSVCSHSRVLVKTNLHDKVKARCKN